MRNKNATKKNWRFIDLFAGIGGFHLAFHRQGAECVYASEKDPFARKTYFENFKKISPNYLMETYLAVQTSMMILLP